MEQQNRCVIYLETTKKNIPKEYSDRELIRSSLTSYERARALEIDVYTSNSDAIDSL